MTDAWINVKDELPPVNVEVIAGYWDHSSYLKPEFAWKFLWGNCVMLPEDNLTYFPEGKRWLTFGPSHSQITHWMYPAKPPTRETD